MTMSSQDKTRSMLMDSMRKTKEGVSAKTEPVATTKSKQKKQPQQKKRMPAKKTARTTPKKVTKKVASTATGQYQSARRVWPD